MDAIELLRLVGGEIIGPIRVGRVSDRVASAIGATTTIVWLSSQTVHKQETKRTAGDISLYKRAPAILESPFILIEEPHHAIFLMHEKTDKVRSYKAVIKATENGSELYLVSVHRIDRNGVRNAFIRGTRLTQFEKRRREVGPPKNPTLRS